jgi:hypothetical protein
VSIRSSATPERHAEPRENTSASRLPDDSSGPRAALVDALTTACRDAALAGDLTAARIALDALNKILAAAAAGTNALDGAQVVDIDSHRRSGR